ncbi:MAG TPA: hypothetical protein VF956_13225 [Candidatus Dormibacteraeota bacterium]
MTSAGAPAPQASEATPAQSPPQPIAQYYPPPSYPPPSYSGTGALDNRAAIALALAITGLVLGLPLGVPGLVLGPFAYFMGKSAVTRIKASAGALSGGNIARTAWMLGVVATAVGAVVSLIWLIFVLVSISTPTG